MIVFYEYYRLLRKVLQETLRINKEVVDTYENRLDFMVDCHRIYLRPKRTQRDDWANGWFRMTMKDVDVVIKYFDDDWKQALEDTTPLPSSTAQTDPSDKGKDKMETEMQDAAQVPLPGQKRKDGEQGTPETQTTQDGEEDIPETPKKKKNKATKPLSKTALTEDDYELIATRMHDTLKDSFEVMQTSQEKIHSVVEKHLLELKAITEKTTRIQVQPEKVTAAGSSTQTISHEEILAKDRLNTVLIPPGSI